MQALFFVGALHFRDFPPVEAGNNRVVPARCHEADETDASVREFLPEGTRCVICHGSGRARIRFPCSELGRSVGLPRGRQHVHSQSRTDSQVGCFLKWVSFLSGRTQLVRSVQSLCGENVSMCAVLFGGYRAAWVPHPILDLPNFAVPKGGRWFETEREIFPESKNIMGNLPPYAAPFLGGGMEQHINEDSGRHGDTCKISHSITSRPQEMEQHMRSGEIQEGMGTPEKSPVGTPLSTRE